MQLSAKRKNHHSEVIDLIHKCGVETSVNIAYRGLREGVWTDDDLRDRGFRDVIREIKQCVNQPSPITGIPLGAFVDREEKQKVVQWDYLSLEDFFEFLPRRVKGMIADHKAITTQRDYCLKKYGDAPPCPDLVG